MDLEKLKREEAELVEQAYGKPDSEEEVASEDEVLSEDLEDESTEVITHEDLTGPEKKETPPRTSWKKRYASYKASTDNTIRNLRTDNAALRVQVSDMSAKVSELMKAQAALSEQLAGSKDPFEDVFTDEDKELIGTEAVDIIKKAMKNTKGSGESEKVKLLEARLAEIEAEKARKAKADLEALQASSLEDLKVKLGNLIPDWKVLDLEAEFEQYLNDVDDYSGLIRKDLFSRAIQDRDVKRVADFYTDYKSLKPKSRAEILGAKVTPSATGSSPSTNTSGKDNNKRLIPISEYIEFMDLVSRGKYPGTRKEIKLKERQFDEAFIQGRVID